MIKAHAILNAFSSLFTINNIIKIQLHQKNLTEEITMFDVYGIVYKSAILSTVE